MFLGFVLCFATQGAARLGWTWTGTLSNGAAYALRQRPREAARFFEVRLTSLLPENSRPSGANLLDHEPPHTPVFSGFTTRKYEPRGRNMSFRATIAPRKE